MSWLWTLAGLAEWNGWQPDDLERIAASVAEHARYLAGHLSFYSSPYNHLIGEATGLFIFGAWLEGLEPAPGWRSCAREVLLKHGPRQFHRDGFCVEQATGYHFFTLGFLAHALAMGEAAGDPIEELKPSVTKAFEAGALFLQPDGRWPAIGDVDSARAIPVLPDDFWNFRSLYSLGAALCDRPEFCDTAIRPGDELYWLLGGVGVDKFLRSMNQRRPDHFLHDVPRGSSPVEGPTSPETAHVSEAAAQARVLVLPESGYAIATAGAGNAADWLLFDCGPIAEGLFGDATPSTAHGHADALQLLLNLGGRLVLTDPGMPFYFGAREWVDHFRGGGAHNTVEIEDRPIARHSGRLGWSHACKSMRLNTASSAERVLLFGTVELDAGNSIARSVLLVPGKGVWIGDFVTTDQLRTVFWNWQLSPDAGREIAQLQGNVQGVCSGNLRINQWCLDGAATFEVEHSSDGNPAAWHSPGYGRQDPSCRLRTQWQVEGQILAITYIGIGTVSAIVRWGAMEIECAADGTPRQFETMRIDLSPESR